MNAGPLSPILTLTAPTASSGAAPGRPRPTMPPVIAAMIDADGHLMVSAIAVSPPVTVPPAAAPAIISSWPTPRAPAASVKSP